MKTAINVQKYGRGGKCVYMFRYTYAEIRIINMQIEKEDRHMSRVMHITRAPCQRYVLNSKERKKKNKKGGYEYKTKHKSRSARNTTSLERQVEKKAYTHDTHS